VVGLCVIASAIGEKTWRFRRRIAKFGVIVTLTPGTYPAYTIPMAREWAEGLNDAIERGEDPRVMIRVEKEREDLSICQTWMRFAMVSGPFHTAIPNSMRL
jgi:hypothetical protein